MILWSKIALHISCTSLKEHKDVTKDIALVCKKKSKIMKLLFLSLKFTWYQLWDSSFLFFLPCFFLGSSECAKPGNLYFMDSIDKYLNALMCKWANKCSLSNGVFFKDPCNPKNYRMIEDDGGRSAYCRKSSSNLCDNQLRTYWYRVMKNSSDILMPTDCIDMLSCGTTSPIWLNG